MEQCPFHREPVGRWENDEARPVVEVSILCFLECFYTVGLCLEGHRGPVYKISYDSVTIIL